MHYDSGWQHLAGFRMRSRIDRKGRGDASRHPNRFAWIRIENQYDRDSDNAYSDYSTVVTVNALPPTALMAGATLSVSGQPQTFTFSASDPSPVDQALTFSYLINWGDGSAQQTNNEHVSLCRRLPR